MPGNTPAYRTDIFTDTSGKYRWVYELPMLKCFFLLFEVWKVLGMSAAVVALFMTIVSMIDGYGLQGLLFALESAAVPLGILLVLSLPAYWIVTRANNGKYTVLFEMDDSGIDHIQIKTDKAKALDILTTFAGIALRELTGSEEPERQVLVRHVLYVFEVQDTLVGDRVITSVT